MMAVVRVAVLGSLLAFTGAFMPSAPGGAPVDFSDAFLREIVAKMGSGLAVPPKDYLDLPPQGLTRSLTQGISQRAMKDLPDMSLPLDYDALAHNPSIRDHEYLSHSSLLGSILGNYEGKLKQRPNQSGSKSSSTSSSGSSTTSTSSSSSSDGVLPAYCNPPNPCPIGYTASDGCLEEFENTAAFSRDYQAMQDCMCDTEHMFECTDTTQDSEITALARSIQNEGVLDSTLDTIMNDLTDKSRRLVAKKFHHKKSMNPYLQGEKLPIAAKKGGVL